MRGRIGCLDWLAGFAVATAWAAWLLAGQRDVVAYLLPVAIVCVAAGGFGFLAVVQGRRWAMAGLLAVVAVLPAISFRSREIGAVGLDWQNGLKLGLWAMLLLTCALTFRIYAGLLRDRALLAVLSFTGIGILSSLYSPVPAYSAACALGLLAYLLFACLIVARCSERDIMLILCHGLALYLAASWISAVAMPESAFLPLQEGDEDHRLMGLSSHPNMLAVEAACLLCVVLPAAARGYLDRRLAWVFGLLGAATILATGSRTTALALALSVGAVWLRQRRSLPAGIVLSGLGAAGITLVFGLGLMPRFDGMLGSFSRSGDAREILTLTGRTDLWLFVWDTFLDRPLLGYGFNSAEAVLSRGWYGNADAGYNAHNLLLQALLTTGLVGAVPLTFALAVLCCHWLTEQSRTLSSYLIPYLMILGATEAHIASVPTLLTLVLFLAMALTAAERQAPAGSGAGWFSRMLQGCGFRLGGYAP